MNYAKIINYDIANGEGFRTSLFVSGCTNRCPGCFNPEQQDFGYGTPYSYDTFFKIVKSLQEPVISGLSILGGDPLCQDEFGITRLRGLITAAREFHKTVWLWTGFVWEDIMGDSRWLPHMHDDIFPYDCQANLLACCDVVIDGPFIESLKNPSLKWRGSSNQRVIDVKKTLNQGQVILYER